MLLNAYSIFDRKALNYHPPFFATTDGSAVRNLSDVVQDANTLIGRHPSDFVLYCVGTFNDANGEMLPVDPRRHVVDAVALVPLQPELFGKQDATPFTSPRPGSANGAAK